MKTEIKIGSSVINISLLDSITIYSDEGTVLYTSASPEKKRGRKKKEVEPQTDLFDILSQQSVEGTPNPEPKIEVVEPNTKTEIAPEKIRKPRQSKKKVKESEESNIEESNSPKVGPEPGAIHKYLDEDTKEFYWVWQDGIAHPIGKEYIEDKHNEVIEVDEL